MREEQWWLDNWDQHKDFYMYWNTFHFGQDNEDCEQVFIDTTCSEFSFAEYECNVNASYYRCRDDYFSCNETVVNENGESF